MENSDLLADIEQYEQNSYGVNDGQLSQDRTEALNYFYGRPFGNEVEGRSQVVSHDVKDTIMWVMPALMKVFAAGDEVVAFTPKNPNDIQQAIQETAYVNHIFMEKNRGFDILYAWFFDALVSKVGYVKAYWENYTTQKKETYQGLSEDELTLLMQDKSLEVLSYNPHTDENGMTVHDVVIQTEKEEGRVCIEPVAPENMLVSYNVMSSYLGDADFVEERARLSISDLREMGFDVDDTLASDESLKYETESFARDQYGEYQQDSLMDASRKVTVKTVYIRKDLNGDGIAELNRVIVVGTTILELEEAENIPYAALCPVPVAHRHVGLSYVDLVTDIQLIKSTLLRNALDAQYQSIHGRFAVTDRVNLDDMLISRTGGLVRVQGPNIDGAIMPLSNPVDGTRNIDMVQYFDQIRQARTGVTDSFQGIDENALNKTKGGTQMLMSAAQERVALVARVFAETGVKDLFLLIHAIVRKHSCKEEIFRMRNKWFPIDPRTWETRADLTVSVGLGNGNKDQTLQHLSSILNAQQMALPMGITDPSKIYNTLAKLTQNAGFKDEEEFWTDPSNNQQPPPPDPGMAKVQAEAEIAQQKLQAESQAKMQEIQARMQMEHEKMQFEMQIAKDRMMADIQIEREKMQSEMQLKRESMIGEMQINRERIAADAHIRMNKIDTQIGIEGDGLN